MREVVSEPVAAVVSADCPLICGSDVRALVDAVPDRGIAIARAVDAGTNAVAMRPPAVAATVFGAPGSAALHAERARAAGLEAVIVDRPGLALDLDTPADVRALRPRGAAVRDARPPRPAPGTDGDRVTMRYGYKASAEQFGPRELLDYSVLAEELGFDTVAVSDHYQPWRHHGGHAPNSLVWLGALGERTERVALATSVLTPTLR